MNNQFSLFENYTKPLFKSSKTNPCDKCDLAGKDKVQDDGNIETAEVIIIGEAPKEDHVFSDKSGQLLRTILDKCGFTKLYFTNIVRCCPDNYTPSTITIKSCKKYVEETLNKATNKKLIITCGDAALYWFTKQEGKQHRGFFFESKWGKVFSILSPIHILKNLNIKDISGKDSLDFLAEDLKRAKTYIESGETSIDITDKIHIAKTHKEFIDMISSMEHLISNKDQRVGIDFETDSLEIYSPKINVLSVSVAVNKDLVWCIPFKFIEDVSIVEEAYTVVKFIMDNINLLMHNASFDLILGHLKFGCKLNQVDDTMLMYYLLDGNRGGSSKLKRLANDWTNFGDYGVDYATMHELNEQKLVEYNCKDALVLLHLYEQFHNKMDYGMKFCYSQIVKKAQLTLIHASINGMKIDANYALSVQKNLQKEFETIENTTKAYGLNLSSPKQVLAYLNQHRNIHVTNTNQDTLEQYKKDEFVDLLLRYRKIALLKRTYVEPMLLEHSKNDNLVHPQFNIGLTATGRISCSKPNCVSMDTEILTTEGWKKYIDLSEKDYVAGFNGDNIIWEKPIKIWKSDEDYHDMVSVKNTHLDVYITANHRVIYKNRKNNKLYECPATNIPKDGLILHSAPNNTKAFLGIDLDWIRLIIAIQADGHISERGEYIDFSFYKKRKYGRLIKILTALKINFVDKSKKTIQNKIRYRIYIYGINDKILELIGYDKQFPKEWVLMGVIERRTFIEELFHWDGSFSRKNNYSSNSEWNIDFVQALLTLEGWRGHKRVYITKKGSKNFQLDITRKNYSLLTNAKVQNIKEKTFVWCVKVPSSRIVVRRGSDTFITGNCQNIPTRDGPLIEKMFVSRFEDGYIVKADYSQMELRVACMYSNDRKMIEFFNSGKDIHRMTAVEIYGVPDEWFDSKDAEQRKKAKEARSIAKGFNFGVIYGRGAKSIAMELNIDPIKAEKLRRKYFDLFPDLKRWIDNTQDQATQDGYVKSLFGRIRYIPELSSDIPKIRGNGLREAINTPIQAVASDMALLGVYECLCETLRQGLQSKFVNFIHDAMLFDVPQKELEQVICIIKEKAINIIDNLKIPLEIDIQYGKSWGDIDK